jgi:hypothetical protein
MDKVYKYQLVFRGEVQPIELPLGAEVLHFAVQDSSEGMNPIPLIWAKVDPGNETETREFILRGTGHEIGVNLYRTQHIGTVLHGVFVWHLFELQHKE